MANFFYTDANGTKQGPLTPQQIKDLAAQGLITAETTMETDTGHKGKAGQIKGLTFPQQPVSPMVSPPVAAPAPVNPFDALDTAVSNEATGINASPSPPPALVPTKSPNAPFVTLLGVRSVLHVYEDKIILQRESQGSKTLYYVRVSSVQFSAAKIGLPGFLQFTFAGSKDLSGVGEQAIIEAIGDENSFVFLSFQNNLVSAIREFIDAKIGGVDVTNERHSLLSVNAEYVSECAKLHYSIDAKNGTRLQLFGEKFIVNNQTFNYVDLCEVDHTPATKDSPAELHLNCRFLFAPAEKSDGKLLKEGVLFDASQNQKAEAAATFLQNVIGLSKFAGGGCLVLIGVIGALLGSGLGCCCLLASLLF